jgi:hypothetical protein
VDTTVSHAPALLHFDIAQRRTFAAPSGRGVISSAGASSSEEPFAAGPFAALADSLAHDLEPLITAPLPIPGQKARLTRIGGRCPTHGVLLEFDPWEPHAHRCTRCERVYHGREHDDWWAMGAQLWTAERAVHAAALYVVRGDARHAKLAARILRAYTERYESWPNQDNVLGPTRLFFSTYLESLWLLNLCHATALLESAGQDTRDTWSSADASQLRDRVLEPSAALIEGYHEGRSNRQVWNEVAIGSAWRLLGRERDVHARLTAPSGIMGLLATGLDADGFWYEGENYHLFAHRGLWYGVELMRAVGVPLSKTLDARYAAGFVAPFRGLLPDGTFPSRRDSQYASSIRQWRTAEWCELGWAHSRDPRLAALLTTLYDGSVPRRDTGRGRSTADAERNTPPGALTRADLSWRALLMAAPMLSTGDVEAPDSVCLPAQGLAVLRRDRGRTYVALEGGLSGGGHGHPDLLALTLQTGDDRWLQDPGTGSYVEERLAWYRSSWAHHAPMVDGRSQAPATAQLEAFDEADGIGWMVKRVDGIAPGVTMQRTIVVAEDYLIDVLEWEASSSHVISVPIAADADLLNMDAAEWQPHELSDDDPGSRFMRRAESLPLDGVAALRARAAWARSPDERVGPAGASPSKPSEAHLWYVASQPALVARAIAPGPPGLGDVPRHWIEARAARGRIVGVWSWPTDGHRDGAVSQVHMAATGDLRVRVDGRDGRIAQHVRTSDGWRVETSGQANARVTQLARRARPLEPASGSDDAAPPKPMVLAIPAVAVDPWSTPPGSTIPGGFVIDLGEPHYVRTELPWRLAGAPAARVQMATAGEWLVVDVDVSKSDPLVLVDNAENPLDNEPHDVNADGVQWYLNAVGAHRGPDPSWEAAGLIVPDAERPVGARCRHTRIAGSTEPPDVKWAATGHGWAMRLRWPLQTVPTDAAGAVAFELVVNERPPARERRRGQLVLSGGGGFGYLAGPRRPVDRFVILSLVPPHGKTTFR